MGAGYLVDSNVIIDLVLGRLPSSCARWLDRRIVSQQVYLSVINRIEILVKTEPASDYILMQEFIQSVTVFSIDEPAIWETIKLRQLQQAKRLPDAIVAATAMVHNLVLITRNTSDFKNVPGLTLLNLHNEPELIVLGIADLEDSE